MPWGLLSRRVWTRVSLLKTYPTACVSLVVFGTSAASNHIREAIRHPFFGARPEPHIHGRKLSPTMPEPNSLIRSYVHLSRFPRANEALHTLKKIASLVKPIMRARNWRVKELAEFYPDESGLLGNLTTSTQHTEQDLVWANMSRHECEQGQADTASATIRWR